MKATLMQHQACTYLGCREGAALKAALPVMPRPATSALTSYVPSYVNMASMSPNAFATCSDAALYSHLCMSRKDTEGTQDTTGTYVHSPAR